MTMSAPEPISQPEIKFTKVNILHMYTVLFQSASAFATMSENKYTRSYLNDEFRNVMQNSRAGHTLILFKHSASTR